MRPKSMASMQTLGRVVAGSCGSALCLPTKCLARHCYHRKAITMGMLDVVLNYYIKVFLE